MGYGGELSELCIMFKGATTDTSLNELMSFRTGAWFWEEYQSCRGH